MPARCSPISRSSSARWARAAGEAPGSATGSSGAPGPRADRRREGLVGRAQLQAHDPLVGRGGVERPDRRGEDGHDRGRARGRRCRSGWRRGAASPECSVPPEGEAPGSGGCRARRGAATARRVRGWRRRPRPARRPWNPERPAGGPGRASSAPRAPVAADRRSSVPGRPQPFAEPTPTGMNRAPPSCCSPSLGSPVFSRRHARIVRRAATAVKVHVDRHRASVRTATTRSRAGGALGASASGRPLTPCYTPGEYERQRPDRPHAAGPAVGSAARRGLVPRRRDDLRLVQQPDRAVPAQDRRRRGGERQPRDRGGHDPLPARDRRAWRARRGDREGGLRGPPGFARGRRGAGDRRGRDSDEGRRARRDRADPRPRAARARDPVGREHRRRDRDHGPDVRAPPADDARRQPARPLARDLHPVLGRASLLPGRLEERPPRRHQHEHARRRRHERRLGLLRLRDDVPRGHHAGRPARRDLLRLVHDHHRPDPPREVARVAGQGPHDRRHPPPGRAPGQDRPARPPGRRRRRGRSSRSSRATSCASARARRSRSTASSARARAPSTRRCSPARRCRSRRAPATR